MKWTGSWLFTVGIVVLFVSCQSSFNNVPPPVTEKMVSVRGNMASVERLNEGRRVFASRCLECHILPPISRYPEERWKRIVNWMGPRASLKADEREAMIAYILAARAQQELFESGEAESQVRR